MDLLAVILILIVQGLVLGALARLALPGPDPMSLPQTIGLGVAGALIAGLIGYFVLGTGAGFLLAFACTVGLVYLVRRSRGGTLTRPGGGVDPLRGRR